MTRHYRVGGLVFGVELSSPFSFMDYVPAVAARISHAAAGDPVDVLPTRAGDQVPPRTMVMGKDDLPAGWDPLQLDFSQYEPFFVPDSPDQEEIFHLTVLPPDAKAQDLTAAALLLRVDDMPPCYDILRQGGDTIFAFDGAGTLTIGPDLMHCTFRPVAADRSVSFYITTSLMILYTYACARHDALLIHASAVDDGGRANLFLGKSGTGKSTHSRLWLSTMPDITLVNDDNPVLRMEDGKLYVYGSPWSGKTPCYRNVKEGVRAIVSLNQAPCNKIRPLKGLEAYARLVSSVSSVRWEREFMDKATAVMSSIAMSVPCYEMDCLPDADAARVCRQCISKTGE